MTQPLTTAEPKRRRLPLNPSEWANPYYDSSKNVFWKEERLIIQRLLAGDKLVESRHWIEEVKGHAVTWWWGSVDGKDQLHNNYPTQYDAPITRLWSRGIIRPVRCAGGFTYMTLTEAALHRFADFLPPELQPLTTAELA